MAPLASISARVCVKSPGSSSSRAEQQLARVHALAGREVGERALDAVAHRRPAVLVDPPRVVHRQRLAGVVARGQAVDEPVRERGDAVDVLDARLRVRHAQLERAVGRMQAQLEPPAARVRDGVRALAPAQRVGEPLPALDRRRHALALQVDRDRRAGSRPALCRGRRERGRWRPARRAPAGASAARCRPPACGRRRPARRAGAGRTRAGAARARRTPAACGGSAGRRSACPARLVVGCAPAVISRPSGAAAATRSRRAARKDSTAVGRSGHGGVTISSCEAGSSSL